jgi:hypothetical protein
MFPDLAALGEISTQAASSAVAGGTPRTPAGTPRTPRERMSDDPDRLKQRDQRQSESSPRKRDRSTRPSVSLTTTCAEEMIVSEILSDIDTSQISRMK